MSKKRIDYYDLREAAQEGKLRPAIGRIRERERLARVLGRRIHNNAFVIGPNGIGKTAMVEGWARAAAKQQRYSGYELIALDPDHLQDLESMGTDWARDAFGSMPQGVVVIDGFGSACYHRTAVVDAFLRAYSEVLTGHSVRVIATLLPHEHEWLVRERPAFATLFEPITLKTPSPTESARVLQAAVPRLNEEHALVIPTATLGDIVNFVGRFPTLGQLPAAGIRLLDECIAAAAGARSRILGREAVAAVVESKTGIPAAHLKQADLARLTELENVLKERIVGQDRAIAAIAKTLERAKLGLRNPNRPLASFLMLGPSGVGKTETAKLVAELLFGRSEAFTRYDMSEFQQDHTVQRLLGAPAGYIGFEEGGALTNALRKEPYSLVLLDEIEKAHQKVFDIFLQVLDDGRLTSGQNETVDARNAVFVATSNAGVPEILSGIAAGEDVSSESFLRERLMPALAQSFRLEFLNRFDAILVFGPLGLPGLVQVAELEIRKLEKRLAEHKVRFSIQPDVLQKEIARIADPRFGARPVKRYVEEVCETLLANALLGRQAQRV